LNLEETIQSDLPNFPHEVIHEWLLPFAEDEGWPPDAPRWRYLMFNNDLGYWRATDWNLELTAYENVRFTAGGEDQLARLLGAYVFNQNNEYFQQLGARWRERFQFQLNQLTTSGTLSSPPVVLERHGTIDIMDGNHRIAAYYALHHLLKNQGVENVERIIKRQSTWVGRLNA